MVYFPFKEMNNKTKLNKKEKKKKKTLVTANAAKCEMNFSA